MFWSGRWWVLLGLLLVCPFSKTKLHARIPTDDPARLAIMPFLSLRCDASCAIPDDMIVPDEKFKLENFKLGILRESIKNCSFGGSVVTISAVETRDSPPQPVVDSAEIAPGGTHDLRGDATDCMH